MDGITNSIIEDDTSDVVEDRSSHGQSAKTNIPTRKDFPIKSDQDPDCTACALKGCNAKSDDTLLKCSVATCNKKVHVHCYETFFRKENNLLTLLGTTGERRVLFCCSKHHEHCIKHDNPEVDPSKIDWYMDGKDGPKDPNTSEKIVVDWISDKKITKVNRILAMCPMLADILTRKQKADEEEAEQKETTDKKKSVDASSAEKVRIRKKHKSK